MAVPADWAGAALAAAALLLLLVRGRGVCQPSFSPRPPFRPARHTSYTHLNVRMSFQLLIVWLYVPGDQVKLAVVTSTWLTPVISKSPRLA